MGKQIDKLREVYHERILEMRRIERTISTPEFELAWETSNRDARRIAKRWIFKIKHIWLMAWMREQLSLNRFKKYSFRDLRSLGSRFHIPYYSRLSRQDLTARLIEKGAHENLEDRRDPGLPKNASGALGRDETIPVGSGNP